MKKTSIGGQALIEGILMRGPEKDSIAIRKPDGHIDVKINEKNKDDKAKIFTLPFFRGIYALVDSLKVGYSALNYSASFWEEEDEGGEGFLDKFLEGKSESFKGIFSLAISFALAILLFFFIPTMLTSLVRESITSTIGLNLIEGLIRVLVFLAYIILISKMDDMKRIFMYHGAEHKTIYAYEKGLELSLENIRKERRDHPRCGTSFIFNIMIISVLVLSFFGWPNPALRLLTRILMIPVIAGISYEINKWAGRSESFLARLILKPGLFLQRIATVKEPDDGMIEVAVSALEPVIPDKEGLDRW